MDGSATPGGRGVLTIELPMQNPDAAGDVFPLVGNILTKDF